MRRHGIPGRPSLVLGLLATLAACSDTPVEPPRTMEPSLSVQPAATGDHLIAVSRGGFGAVSGAIADLGGSVARAHDGAGFILAQGLSDEAVATLAAMNGVKAIAADLLVQGVPEMGAPATESAGAAGVAGHDPTTAFFWPRQWDMRIIDADAAWAAGHTGNAGVTAAIIDTGIDPFHQDLAGLVDWGRSIAFVPSLNGSGPSWGDDHFHGTHVGGTVASNGLGTSGVAPHTTLVAVKVCNVSGSCPLGAIFSGILYSADIGANVANLSLGGFIGKSLPGGGQLNAIYNQIVDYATRKGTLVVSAAGNSGLDLDHLGRDYGAGSYTAVPCEAGNGVCVSATNVSDAITSYSNYGASAVNVAAPGGDGPVPSRILAPCSTLSLQIPVCGTSPTWYLWLTGTSMAAPHVTGAAALLAAKGVTSPGQLKTALQRTADDLGKKGADPFYSKGRVNVFDLVR